VYAGCKRHAVSSPRTPGTGGVIDLWRNNDGTPSKLATGRWTEGQGRPQGVGKRWRGWYVGDDGKTRTKRFRTEVEAEGWSNAQRGKVLTNQWLARTWAQMPSPTSPSSGSGSARRRSWRSMRPLTMPGGSECNLPANRPNAGVWAL
jgi:hypothetical protein